MVISRILRTELETKRIRKVGWWLRLSPSDGSDYSVIFKVDESELFWCKRFNLSSIQRRLYLKIMTPRTCKSTYGWDNDRQDFLAHSNVHNTGSRSFYQPKFNFAYIFLQLRPANFTSKFPPRIAVLESHQIKNVQYPFTRCCHKFVMMSARFSLVISFSY